VRNQATKKKAEIIAAKHYFAALADSDAKDQAVHFKSHQRFSDRKDCASSKPSTRDTSQANTWGWLPPVAHKSKLTTFSRYACIYG